MTPTTRRWILTIGGVVTVATVALGVLVLLPGEGAPSKSDAVPDGPPPSVEDIADQFVAAFAAGDVETASTLTDDAASAGQLLTAFRRDLAPASATGSRTAPVAPGPGATSVAAPFQVSWEFGAGRSWSYASTLPLTKTGDQWRVHWTPALVHPKLTANHRIVQGDQVGQPAVLDRAGTPLLAWQTGVATPVDATLAPLLTPAMARVAAEQGGSGGWHIAIVDAAGTVVERLTEPAGGQGKPLTATLSIPTQKAAQAAVDSVPQAAMLVAIQPSTGDLLAVAQNSAAGADPAVLSGLYPPGSTFKIATATAVLQAGLASSDTVLPCPGEARIGSRTIANDNHFQATIASGNAVTPTLWRDLPTTVDVGYEPPPRAVLDQVRAMMREVVTGGTATALAGRGAVFGKTGTAQFGPDGTHAHGWFTGYRGDLAFAILVLSGESSAPALSVSNTFLAA